MVEAERLLEARGLGFSHLRLLPKNTGMRLIFNMGRKVCTRVLCIREVALVTCVSQSAFLYESGCGMYDSVCDYPWYWCDAV